MLGLLGVIATHLFDIHNCRMIVHLSWIVLMLAYYGIIVLGFIFLPGGAVL